MKRVREILENGLVVTAIALVVGLLVVAFNPQTADTSGSPFPAGRVLKP